MAKKPSAKKPGRPKSPRVSSKKSPRAKTRPENAGATVIRKYANRRLYNTDTASFVTLDDLRQMVINGEPFVVVDAKTHQDITSSLLAQIVADQESHGESMLPNDVLRQIISFYEKGMSESVSTYLQKSMATFTDNWQQAQQIGDIGRRNMELFQQNLANMFGQVSGVSPRPEEPAAEKPADDEADLETELQEQMRVLQEKLDALSKKPK